MAKNLDTILAAMPERRRMRIGNTRGRIDCYIGHSTRHDFTLGTTQRYVASTLRYYVEVTGGTFCTTTESIGVWKNAHFTTNESISLTLQGTFPL